MNTLDDVMDRLTARGANHDMTAEDLLAKLPPNIDTPQEIDMWLDTKEISHIKPVSTHPHLVNDPDNWVWEDPDVNRARGDMEMTSSELLVAEIDNDMDAMLIDTGADVYVDPNPFPFF